MEEHHLARWSKPSGQARVDLLLALAVLLIAGPILQHWSAQPASRYLLTVAIVDDHSLRLDPYVGGLGPDHAVFEGHVYSDKAPYQPTLAAPAYQLYRAVGGDPFPTLDGQRRLDVGRNFGLWWVTLWSATVPAVLLIVVLRRLVATVDPGLAVAASAAMTLGTVILPFSSWLFGHVLAALWVAVAWRCLRPPHPSARGALVAGLCLGAGIGTEYTVAALAVVLLVDQLMRRQIRAAALMSIGTALGTLPLLAYNWLVFSNPFEVSYQGHLPNFQGEGALGVYNLEVPRMAEIGRALVGDRGLFVLTPVVLAAVVGCAVEIFRRGSLRRDALVALSSLVIMVALTTGIDGLGGDSPGPRYLIPVLPLLTVPLVCAWRLSPFICTAAAGWGFTAMWMASVTAPDLASSVSGAFGLWAQRIVDGELVQNIVTGRSHSWLLPLFAGAGLACLVRAWREERRSLELMNEAPARLVH